MNSDWHWINLPGGHKEELLADICELEGAASTGRACLVVQTNATSSFHVSFSHSSDVPIRGTDQPNLRFVVGKRKNSMTSVGIGSPYLNKEPIEFTKSLDALLTDDPEKSRCYWFLYDKTVGVAAMGVQTSPQPDLCRLVCRFRDAVGFRAELCEGIRYISVSSGKMPVSLRIVSIGTPPDVSIPRHRFDPLTWCSLQWQGNSVAFEVDAVHRNLIQKAQKLLTASPIAPYYGLVEPACFCVNAYRLLDPLRRSELFPGEDADDLDWGKCHDEVHKRLMPVLQSAPWTYWPLRFEKADCTTLTLAPASVGCSHAVSEWARAVRGATALRNNATNREMLTLSFAFEVFPVEGENAAQARRDLVREISGLFEKEWGVMEFRCPIMVAWETHTRYTTYPLVSNTSS